MAEQDSSRKPLLDAIAELGQAIRASEDWHPSYTGRHATFSKLLRFEAHLEQCVAGYLVGLAYRCPQYVDWSQVPEPVVVKAAGTPLANKSDDVWAAEKIDFQKAVIDAISSLVALGGQAGELDTGIVLGINELSESVLKAAREQTATLVSQVTDTNRSLIQEAIKQGIARGENTGAITERIRKVINNPVRAEMIAQTESVNAYQIGQHGFAVQTQAQTKTWQALPGACARYCAPTDGETVPIDKPFSNGVMYPSAHSLDRCNVKYNY